MFVRACPHLTLVILLPQKDLELHRVERLPKSGVGFSKCLEQKSFFSNETQKREETNFSELNYVSLNLFKILRLSSRQETKQNIHLHLKIFILPVSSSRCLSQSWKQLPDQPVVVSPSYTHTAREIRTTNFRDCFSFISTAVDIVQRLRNQKAETHWVFGVVNAKVIPSTLWQTKTIVHVQVCHKPKQLHSVASMQWTQPWGKGVSTNKVSPFGTQQDMAPGSTKYFSRTLFLVGSGQSEKDSTSAMALPGSNLLQRILVES